MMSVRDRSISAVLARRAEQHPDDVAYTFVDYDVDPAGIAESLTWAQVHNRVQVVARELEKLGTAGDRAAILAPQGLEYIVGVLGALEAGFVAVPLPVPMLGAHDERATAVLRDCTPAVVLTTSAAVDAVLPALSDIPGGPTIVEIDALDLDSPVQAAADQRKRPRIAFLQYTSGSTRTPAGVIVTHDGLLANLRQVEADYFEDTGGVTPPGTTFVSWLPFYHDMGLIIGVFAAIDFDATCVLTSPMAFLQKPARWIQMMAENDKPVTAAPNFAYELAVRRTSDDDMAGLDLAHVSIFMSGAERVQAATLRRFTERFAQFNLPDTALRAAYGLAEATVYVASALPGRPPSVVRFDYEKLSQSYAVRCDDGGGVELIGHGTPRACTVRIVDPETCVENPAGKVGEIWVFGPNVSAGYWRKPQVSARTFQGRLVDPSPGTPQGPWLRTGDLGVFSEGELFILGRIKDLLIVDGRNHYPDDIEATIQEISGGRVAAISVQADRSEQLIAIVEYKNRGDGADSYDRIQTLKRELTAAISRSHGVRVSDLVFVAPGSIPITTSGKIRRSSCVELYRGDAFARLDAAVRQ